MSIDINFNKGRLYRRREIHKKYGGQIQGGISTPSKYPIILLFDTPRGADYGYFDGWTDEGVFRWIGEGQSGDQKLIRGNLAIAQHLEEREDIHLFKQEKSGMDKQSNQTTR